VRSGSQGGTPSPPLAMAAAPVAAPRGPRERQLRFGHFAAAVALIVVGALGTAALVTAASADDLYLAISRDVDFGAVLTDDDLVEVRIGNPPELRPVAASERHRVVGNYASMPLAAGTLLTAAHVTAEPVPAVGQHVVGITLRGERLPAQRPRPGDAVLLVATAERGGDTSMPTWRATVPRVTGHGGGLLDGSSSRTITLDVSVPAANGPEIARLAAANRIVVVLDGGR
jgi:hypothetical protein